MILPLLILMAVSAAPVAERRPPIDECVSDRSFAAFRDELGRIIARRDRDALLAVLADNVFVHFGGGSGRADFIDHWNLDRPASSAVWTELEEALALGCAREEGMLWAPSLFVQLSDQEDPFAAMVSIRPGAPLHARPNRASPIVERLDWHLLTGLSPEADGWIEVALSNGRRGHVRSEDVRGQLDYRAGFARDDGRWRLAFFIAGD